MKVFLFIFIFNSVCAFNKLSVNIVEIQQRHEPIKNHRFLTDLNGKFFFSYIKNLLRWNYNEKKILKTQTF